MALRTSVVTAGPATGASLSYPYAVAVDTGGGFYIADQLNHRVRKVIPAGIITTVAGNGFGGFGGDNGLATSASLNGPLGVAVDAGGSLYIADYVNSRIRKVTPNGLITTVAGNGRFAFSGDGGPATSASLNGPTAIAFDTGGSLFMADSDNGRIRKVTAAGIITTVAGNGNSVFSGDGGPAASASLYGPRGITVDAVGSLYIGDTFNNRIRKVDPAGTITTIAGNGVQGFNGDNVPAASTGLNRPHGMSIDGAGNVYIAEENHRIRRVDRSLVPHYYLSILRRLPDASGKAFWESEVTRVQGLGANNINEIWYALAGTFLASAEYQALQRDNAGFVTDLYTTFFARAPDATGLADWTGKLAAGMPREVVLAAFMFSSEFASFTQNIYGTAYTRKEIDTIMDFYRGLLARLPDGTGFSHWLQQFRAAQCQGPAAVTTLVESISRQFTQMGEYTERNRTNAQYVGDLYNAFMRRGADLDGVKYWIGQLDSGARTRDNVRREFMASPEFTGRVNAIVAQGCLL